MEIRKAKSGQLERIMEIYDKARTFMADHGNPNQWVNGYPQRELVKRDLDKGWLYVCMQDKEIAGVFMFYQEPEPNYREIWEGSWLNDRPYGTMHRMASAGKIRGVSAFCLEWCYNQCRNLKGDTHPDNYVMQNVFGKNGFKRCGIIRVEDKSLRIAYQKE